MTDNPVYPEIPRWRFWWGRGSPGFIFKSKRSEWNNLMVNYRPYPWSYKRKRFGITIMSVYAGLLIVLDLGWARCISIHYHPRYASCLGGWEYRLPERLKQRFGVDLDDDEE